MNRQAYHRHQRQLFAGQAAWDSMTPPDEYCSSCGREASVDCICTGEAVDIDEPGYDGVLDEG